MIDLRDENELAALIKYIRTESQSWQVQTFELTVWAIHELVTDDDFTPPELSDVEVHDILAEMPTSKYVLLDDEQQAEVHNLREKGVNYQSIARIMEAKPNAVDEISRETIRRYCKDADVEPEEAV